LKIFSIKFIYFLNLYKRKQILGKDLKQFILIKFTLEKKFKFLMRSEKAIEEKINKNKENLEKIYFKKYKKIEGLTCSSFDRISENKQNNYSNNILTFV